MGKTKSKGSTSGSTKKSKTSQVTSMSNQDRPKEDLLDFLQSDSDGEIKEVHISDTGSQSVKVEVEIQGVPVEGVIDNASDITIMEGELFKKVASVAKLKRKSLKRADKTPRTYDMRVFTLDGRMNLDIKFGGRTMNTPVYIKMDSPTGLLLSEKICQQLRILTYHPSIDTQTKDTHSEDSGKEKTLKTVVPMVTARLFKTERLLPRTTTAVTVDVGATDCKGPMTVELHPDVEKNGLHVDSVLWPELGEAQVLICNQTSLTQRLDPGEELEKGKQRVCKLSH